MASADYSAAVRTIGDGVALAVKVVPGARKQRIAGLLGERLKVTVSAPPEGGRANEAVCRLLAETFGVPVRNVVIAEGHAQPRKTVHVLGLTACAAVEALDKASAS